MSEEITTASTALQRNRAAASALSVAARQLRFAKSRRSKMFEAVGLRPRLIDRVSQLVFAALVALVLVVPNVTAIIYFGFLASDQYTSETRFALRTSEPTRANDDLAEASGIHSALIAQDTQIIANYIHSRGMVDRLAQEIDFTDVFGHADIDWYARLRPDATIEDRIDYWEKMVDVSLAPRSGIITIEVRAFAPGEAHAINRTLVSASEALVNAMNDRIWQDATGSAREEVARATGSLSQARLDLQTARNEAGILTIDGASASISALLTQAQGELIALQNDFEANRSVVSADAPQMRVLSRQIAAKRAQIQELRSQIAGTQGGSLADRSTVFAQLELEQTLAEDRLATSITALEQLQYASRQQLIYLDPFLSPTLPDGAQHPRRLLWIGIVFATSLVVFAALAAIASTVRTRLD